jgi:sugar O-acyltransferase (sialic acid O-acetyltransferase NeuD family)
MKEKLILIGAGGHCKACIDVIEQEGRFEIAGILDVPEKIGTKVLGYPVIGSDDIIGKLINDYRNFFITIGQVRSSETRIRIFERLKEHGLELPVIISPRAYVSGHATVGEGTIIMHGTLVNAGATIGRNCILNTNSLIEHDSKIGDHCHVSTGAIINGGVSLGDRCFFGSNAVSNHYISIPADSFIKANSLIK